MTVNKAKQPFRLSAAPAVEASGESRGCRVLAGASSRRAGSHAPGDLARADRDVPGAAASLQRPAEQRRHVPRRSRPRRSEARRSGNRGRQIQGPAARHSVGREGHHLAQGLPDDVGIGAVQGAGARLRRERDRTAARCGRGADREGHHRRACRRRQLVWRPDEESVGSGARLERIIRRSIVGDGRWLRRVRHRHRDERIDSQPVGALRTGRPSSDVRPRQPLRRDGAVVDAGSSRSDLPLRGRHRDRHAGDRQAGRPRHERRPTCRSTGTRRSTSRS